MFHKYGIENPRSGMAEKVIGYQFSEKIEVRDPYTRKKDKKHIKPFMVNNSVNVFEKGKIVLNPKDKDLISQLEEYRVKSISNAGLPIYTDENEHAIDALNLALLAFEQHHSELMRKIYSTKTAFIGFLDKRDADVTPRDLKPEIPVGFIADKSQKGDVISVIGVLGASRGRAAAKSSLKSKFSRRMF